MGQKGKQQLKARCEIVKLCNDFPKLISKMQILWNYSPFTLASNSLRKSDGEVVDDGRYFSCMYAATAAAPFPFSINGLVAVEFNFKLMANGVVAAATAAAEQLSLLAFDECWSAADGCCFFDIA